MNCTLILKNNQSQESAAYFKKESSKPTKYHTHKTPFQRRQRFYTTKELDQETGLYYFGARYLDPKTSRWLGVDPAMGEYVPSPGANSGDLPGMGGVYNTVNFHTYHYGANNPIKYVDPDGRKSGFVTNESAVGVGPVSAGHSGMWVERYDKNGSSVGFSFFEVGPIKKNASATYGGEPLTLRMAILGGSSGGSSIGSLISGIGGSSTGASVGSVSGALLNEAAISVGVNEYRFDTRENMEKGIAKLWFDNESATGEIRQTVFNTSKAQDRTILNTAEAKGRTYGRYDVLSNNCAQYASSVLSSGGVNTTSQPVPRWSHDYIDKNNQDLIGR